MSIITDSNRQLILDRFAEREKRLRPIQTMFRNYAILAEQLTRKRKRLQSSPSGNYSSDEIIALKEELSNVYKLKSKNDQDLIDANRRLIETESNLANIMTERDKLKLNTEKLCARIASLEIENKELKESSALLNNERLSLLASFNALSTKLQDLEEERMKLLEKITELEEKRIEYMNAEVALQEERAQRRLREEIARAVQDQTNDSAALNALRSSPDTSADDIVADVVPKGVSFKIAAHDSEVNDVEWVNEDIFVSSGSDSKIRVWKVSPNRKSASKICTLTGCNNSVARIDCESSRRVVLAASIDKTCRLWNIDTQSLLQTFSGHTEKLSAARFHQTHHIVSGGYDRTIRLWDIAGFKCIRNYFVGSSVLDIVSKCGVAQGCFASAHFDKRIRIWDSRQADPVKTIDLGHRVTSVDVSLDGSQILASCRDDTLSLLDVRTGGTVHMYSAEQYRTTSDLGRAIFSSTGEYIATGGANGYTFIWNTRTTRLEKTLRTATNDGNAIFSLSWNPTGRELLVCDKQKTCTIFR